MSYFLPEGYTERLDAPQMYDEGGTDEWQDEVYREAAKLADVFDLRAIADIGTGSGFKLIKYFQNYHTVGYDLEPAIVKLRHKYPTKCWQVLESDFGCYSADLVICSDVIEHINDPDFFLANLKSAYNAWFVISTPDRKLLERYPKWGKKMGPPSNGCHVREWAFNEFRQYMDSHFEVFRHFISNKEQCTQCMIARMKKVEL